MFKKTRLEKGYKVTDVVRYLNISEEYVKALESGDLSKLPSQVYILGFARSYATFLGLDSQDVIKSFKESLNIHQKVQEVPNVEDNKLKAVSSIPNLLDKVSEIITAKQVFAVIALLGLMLIGYKVMQSSPKQPPAVLKKSTATPLILSNKTAIYMSPTPSIEKGPAKMEETLSQKETPRESVVVSVPYKEQSSSQQSLLSLVQHSINKSKSVDAS